MALNYALTFKASPTVSDFIRSRAAHKVLWGPVGGGKTSGCVLHILMNAIEQEPDNDGVRRTRHLVVRNTVPMLKQTTIKSFLDWIPDGVFGRWLSSDKTYYMKFDDVEAEVLFMSLEDANDIRKLLSLETTTAFFNEFREIDPEVIEGLIGTKRIGRYPSRKQGPGATYPCIMADTNAPAMDTWHQQAMEGEIGDWTLFKQPSGRSPEAENLDYLPKGYYDTEGLSEEYIKTMIDCEYGTSREGLPVFRTTFIPGFHIAPAPLIQIVSDAYPLLIGLDAGLTPAAVIGQMTPRARLHILAECFTEPRESMGMERFLLTRLMPMLRSKFAGCPVRIIVDPAAIQRAQANEETVYEMAKAKIGRGNVILAPTNKTDLRVGSAEILFGKQVEGKAYLLIDAACTGLVNALKHGYKFAARKDGEMEEKPAKTHPFSDICFVAGTPIVTPAGEKKIQHLRVGDEVAVSDGVDVVTAVGKRFAPRLVRLTLSDGTALICTPEHPFAVKKHTCFLPADELNSSHQLVDVKEGIWGFQKAWFTQRSARPRVFAHTAIKSFSFRLGAWLREKAESVLLSAASNCVGEMASSTMGSGLGNPGRTSIFGTSAMVRLFHYTGTCGRNYADLSLMDTKCITSTATSTLRIRTISSASKGKNTTGSTSRGVSQTVHSISRPLWRKLRMLLKRGMRHLKVALGIVSTARKSPLHVVRKDYLSEGRVVYNITTGRTHTFYAGSALVHNCDAFTYLTVHVTGVERMAGQPRVQQVQEAPVPSGAWS